MSQDVIIRASVQDAELIRAWQNARKGPEGMAQEMGKLKGRAAQANTTMTQWIASAVAGFGVMEVGAKAFRKMLELINEDYELMLQRQKNAADFQSGLVGPQRAALRNLGDADIKLLTHEIPAIAARTGTDLANLYSAASGVLSARGEMSGEEAIGQLGAVVKLDPSLPAAEQQSLAGATLDIGKAYGGTAEQRIGAMLAGQQTSRIEETGQYARNIVPAVVGLKGYDNEFREASALVSTISQQSVDVKGERSGTAALTFAKQILQATATRKELEGQGTTERIDWLISGDPEAEKIRQQLLGSLDVEARKAGADERGELTGEAKQFMALKGLLTPDSDARKAFETAYAATPDIGEAEKVYRRNLDLQKQLDAQQVGGLAEAFRGAKQAVQAADPREARIGQVRQDLFDLLNEAGDFGTKGALPGIQRRTEALRFKQEVFRGASPEQAAVDILEHRLGIAERQRGGLFGLGTRSATPPEQANERAFRDLAARLQTKELGAPPRGDKQSQETQKALARALEENTRAVREQTDTVRASDPVRARQRSVSSRPKPKLGD